MKEIFTFIIVCSAFLLGETNLWAQQGMLSFASEATNYAGAPTNLLAANVAGGEINEVVFRPYEFAVVNGADENGIVLGYDRYPGASTVFITLTVENEDTRDLSYWFGNLKGQVMQHGRLNEKTTRISMDHHPNAIYIVRVFDKKNEIKSFKIIKNQ